MRCPKCGSNYSSVSNFESHWRGSHFGVPPQLSNSESDRPYEVGIEPNEDARADTPAGRILHLGQPEPESRPIAQPVRAFHYTCPVCYMVLDSKTHPLCLNELQLQVFHEIIESPECKTGREAIEQAEQNAIESKSKKFECSDCNRTFIGIRNYEQHLVSKEHAKRTTPSRARQYPSVNQMVAILRKHGVTGSNEALRNAVKEIRGDN